MIRFRRLLFTTLLFLAALPATYAQETKDIREYIRNGWQTLSRSMEECGSVADIKVSQTPVLYFPQGMPVPAKVKEMEQRCGVKVAFLAHKIEKIGDMKPEEIKQHGLLYLPNPYVVPGGRFNEMYGWDSYFIILGLEHDGNTELAKGMVENFFFEIENYGSILNANRTYFFTRSQPPLLTSMIMAVQGAKKDPEWMKRAYDYAVRDYSLWNRAPHLAGDTGLARYFDFGEGPVPETADDPHYFAEVASAMLTREREGREYLNFTGESGRVAGPEFSFMVCADTAPAQPSKSGTVQACAPKQNLYLTRDYYKGDRSMRESGYDISFRFGPYSGSTHHFAPVCLNSLLYKAERDLAAMAAQLGKTEESADWLRRSERRKAAINKYLWNEKTGMFFDYNVDSQKQSDYHFATTFYPLWAGLATPEQAKAVTANLPIFEHEGGIATSDRDTGMQWDMPYAWAPVQYFAIAGLRTNGFVADADRLAKKFSSMVEENFQRDGTIREKYNVQTRSTMTAVSAGYKSNVVGFGWTNGVYLEFAQPQK